MGCVDITAKVQPLRPVLMPCFFLREGGNSMNTVKWWTGALTSPLNHEGICSGHAGHLS
jgi:hypothetical protein